MSFPGIDPRYLNCLSMSLVSALTTLVCLQCIIIIITFIISFIGKNLAFTFLFINPVLLPGLKREESKFSEKTVPSNMVSHAVRQQYSHSSSTEHHILRRPNCFTVILPNEPNCCDSCPLRCMRIWIASGLQRAPVQIEYCDMYKGNRKQKDRSLTITKAYYSRFGFFFF